MRLQPSQYRAVTIGALIAVCAIVVTGAAVRLTGSGLGCDDWPNCNDSQLIDVSSSHAAIEQVNRLFTGLVSFAVIAAVLGSARARAPPARPRPGGRSGSSPACSARSCSAVSRCSSTCTRSPCRVTSCCRWCSSPTRPCSCAAPASPTAVERHDTVSSATRATVFALAAGHVTRGVHRHVGDRRRTTCRRRGRAALRVPHPDRRPRPRRHRDGDDRHRPGSVVADPAPAPPSARR